jgi:hypothetical protein
MRTSWDVAATRNLIGKLYGANQLALVRPTLESLAERQTYASYHFHEYKKILHENIDSRLPEKSLLELTFKIQTEEQWRIDNALTQAAANVIACIQSLHCLLDTLAHAVCFTTGLNLGPEALPERLIASHKVRDKLNGKTEFSEVLDHFNEMEANDIVKHLAALVNHSKHRKVLRPSLNVDLRKSGTQSYELEFPAFTHNGKSYPAANVEAFLEEAYGFLSPKIVECGNALNKALDKMTKS